MCLYNNSSLRVVVGVIRRDIDTEAGESRVRSGGAEGSRPNSAFVSFITARGERCWRCRRDGGRQGCPSARASPRECFTYVFNRYIQILYVYFSVVITTISKLTIVALKSIFRYFGMEISFADNIKPQFHLNNIYIIQFVTVNDQP